MFIFLDLDGVLVPEKKFETPVSPEAFMAFDPDCLREFETVLRSFPPTQVVITSSWREVYPFEVIPPLFSPDMAPRVVGATPFLDPRVVHASRYVRHQEVLAYLEQIDQCDSPWVAIDDIPEHYPPEISVVVTDAYHGFDARTAAILQQRLHALQSFHSLKGD